VKEKKVVLATVHSVRHRRNKRIDYILTMWQQEHPGQAVEPHVLAPWAIERGLDKKRPPTQEEMLRREISRELKNQYFVDPQGREVRSNHAILIEIQTPRGIKRFSRWLPLFDAPAEHMRLSAQLRRKSAFADVRQLALDLESYNDNNHFGGTIPIPSFDFNQDIEDSRQSTSYNEEPEDDESDD
jgi:hypothetical protein